MYLGPAILGKSNIGNGKIMQGWITGQRFCQAVIVFVGFGDNIIIIDGGADADGAGDLIATFGPA